MIVYIKGKTRVKGVQNKDVYYVGCVESDGYIYFNDSISYRIPTPATLREENEISVAEVQIWYTVRNCWIRANYFTQLTVYGVDFEHIYGRIGTLETKVSTLESKVATLESKVATLESKVATLENKVATLESKVATLESKVATLETTVADHEIRLVACESQIQSLNTRLVTAENDISNLKTRMTSAETGINNNRNSIIAINDVLGYLPNLIGQNTTLEDYLRTKFNNYDTSFNNISTTLNALVTTVTDHSNRISALEGDYTSVNNALTALTNLVNTINNTLSIFTNDFANFQFEARTAINKLGHRALGPGDYNSSNVFVDGNGETELALVNKLNTVINNVNDLIDGLTIVGHISTMSVTVWTNWADV